MDKIAKVRQEIERRIKRENEILWNAKLRGTTYSPSVDYNLLTLTSLRDFLDTLSGEPDKDLEEAAEEYAEEYEEWVELYSQSDFPTCISYRQAFIAGAQWQAEHDDRDVVFWKGMQYAIKGMKKDAVEGIYTKSMDGKNVFVESGALKIDPASVKVGDPVRIIILPKDDEK